jgi:hypothetical protein
MTASLAMMGAKHAAGTAIGWYEAFQSQAQAQLQSGALQYQMDEIESRTKQQIQNIYKYSDKVTSNQEAAFQSAGVEMSGSAMSVVSDTLNNAAEAAYIRQRESDYDLLSVGMEKYKYDQMASNETLLLNLATTTIGGAKGFASDYADSQKAHTKNRGAATGLSEDAAGGTTSYSRDYLSMK